MRTAARARALAESQALSSESGQPFSPNFRRPEGREEGFKPKRRRENAWTMAKDQERFRTPPGMQQDVQEDDLREEPEAPSPFPEPEINEEPPAILASRWYSKGLDSQMLGRVSEAKAYYTRSLKEDPSYAPSLNNKAVIDMEEGLMEEAEEGFFSGNERRLGVRRPMLQLGVSARSSG